jgi:hypothetical protein
MIHSNNITIENVHSGRTDITAVYHGSQLVWSKQANARSCYDSGYWVDEYPWNDNSHWTD